MKNIACLLARPEYVVTRMVFALRTTAAAVASNDAMAEAVAGSFCRSLWERGCAYTLSGFPIADALLTQPPANGEKDREKEGGRVFELSPSPRLASADESVKEAISHARAAFGPFFLPPRIGPPSLPSLPRSQSLHEMPIRYCYTRRARRRRTEKISAIFFYYLTPRRITILVPLPAHTPPPPDAAPPPDRARTPGGGAPCRGWAIYS